MKLGIRGSRAQSMVEIALIIALVAGVVVTVLMVYGVSLQDVYCQAVALFGATPAACAPNVVWSEDFSDLDRWNFTVGRRWRAEDGKLCAGPRGEHRGFTGDESWDDYTVHVNVAEQYQGNGYGVYFRISNEPRINGYAFQYDPGYGRGAFLIRKIVNGRELWPPIAVSYAPPGYDWYDVTRQVSVRVEGDTFIAYVDGEEVVRATDSDFTQGRIGLRSWDRTVACFDDITVTQP